MTATAQFTGTPAIPTPAATPTPTVSCTQKTLGADPASNSGLAADCAALLQARDALAGTGTLNWSVDTAMTEWDGVTLSGTPQRVTGLSLQLRRLTGTIPQGLGDLEELRSLNLSWNKLRGAVPAGLSGLDELRTLDLSRNTLSGSIPGELGDLAKLEHLTLSQNFLDGGIPAALGRLSKLEGLYLYQNRLTGSIPSELEGLPALGALFLSENQLSGCVPRALRRVARSDLAALGLSSCALPATELGYGGYDSTGAVTAAGSYAFLTAGDDGAMTAVTTYAGLRDGTATSLLIHQSDAAGTSRADVYDALEAGDLVEWQDADDCFVRYRVTGTSVDGVAREFEVRPETYAFESCQTGSPGAESRDSSRRAHGAAAGTARRDQPARLLGSARHGPARPRRDAHTRRGRSRPAPRSPSSRRGTIEPTALALSVPEVRISDPAVARHAPVLARAARAGWDGGSRRSGRGRGWGRA